MAGPSGKPKIELFSKGKDPSVDFDISLDKNAKKKINRTFNPYLKVPVVLCTDGRLQSLMLARVHGRFEPPGSTPTAQKDPRQRPWAELADATVDSGGDNDSKLRRTSKLRDSIKIITDHLNTALYTNTGAGFRIGVELDSEAAEYARIQNYGGWAGRNGAVWIPARRYIGIGQADKIAVNKLIKSILKEQGV